MTCNRGPCFVRLFVMTNIDPIVFLCDSNREPNCPFVVVLGLMNFSDKLTNFTLRKQHVFADQILGRPLVAEEAGFMPAIDLSKYQEVYYVAGSFGDAQQVAR